LLKCIIVEDEVLAQDVIRNHLLRLGQIELLGVYRTAPEAQTALQNLDVDVLFLDIRLPGMSGLHFLRGLTDPPLVVLTTAYAEYALESYIVATKHIRAIFGNSIELGKVTIPIGVNYKDTVMELVGRR